MNRVLNYLPRGKRLVLLRADQIRTDLGTQSRARLYQETVDEYAEHLDACGALPPPRVFRTPEGWYVLARGFHRLAAHVAVGRKALECEVLDGTVRDAILDSVGSNVSHGRRPGSEDKRHAVGLLLADPEWSAWSNAEIARRCGVSPHLVAACRDELSMRDAGMRLARRGDQVYPIQTGTLAQREAAALAELSGRKRREALAELEGRGGRLCEDARPLVRSATLAHLEAFLADIRVDLREDVRHEVQEERQTREAA